MKTKPILFTSSTPTSPIHTKMLTAIINYHCSVSSELLPLLINLTPQTTIQLKTCNNISNKNNSLFISQKIKKCPICLQKINSLEHLFLHLICCHSENHLFAFNSKTKNEDKLIVLIINLGSETQLKTYKINGIKKKGYFEKQKEILTIILEKVFISTEIEKRTSISFLISKNLNEQKSVFQKIQAENSKIDFSFLILKHLRKLRNIATSDEMIDFMTLWNYFCINLKNIILETNFPFSNFFGSRSEHFIILILFLKKFREKVWRMQREIEFLASLLFFMGHMTAKQMIVFSEMMEKYVVRFAQKE